MPDFASELCDSIQSGDFTKSYKCRYKFTVIVPLPSPGPCPAFLLDSPFSFPVLCHDQTLHFHSPLLSPPFVTYINSLLIFDQSTPFPSIDIYYILILPIIFFFILFYAMLRYAMLCYSFLFCFLLFYFILFIYFLFNSIMFFLF